LVKYPLECVLRWGEFGPDRLRLEGPEAIIDGVVRFAKPIALGGAAVCWDELAAPVYAGEQARLEHLVGRDGDAHIAAGGNMLLLRFSVKPTELGLADGGPRITVVVADLDHCLDQVRIKVGKPPVADIALLDEAAKMEKPALCRMFMPVRC